MHSVAPRGSISSLIASVRELGERFLTLVTLEGRQAGLTLLGYIAFLDPPNETAAAAIATLKARGVQVKILTGDNDIVTRKICNDVSLPVDHIVLGHEMETLSPAQLADLAETASVFAKVSPAQKAAIIDALHRKGHVVGYLGED